MQVPYIAGEEARAAIARIGRTEDAQFSPGGSRLAIAGLYVHRLLVFDVEVDLDSDSPSIVLTGVLEIDSASLKSPHGLAWVDERTLIVANREGEVAIFELPPGQDGSARIRLDAVRTIGADLGDLVRTPGSVSALPLGLGFIELLVCNNLIHHVSRHLLDQRDDYAVVASDVLVARGLDVPDGVAHSPSGRWVAVSNHEHHNVHIYRNDGGLNGDSEPHGVLRDTRFAHGLIFSADERSLLVANAGSPFMQLFKSDDGDWTGERDSVTALQIVGDEAFRRGSFNPQEGGPKGIDLREDGLMVATCEEQPLAFFDLRALVQPAAPSAVRSDPPEDERAREALLRYLSSSHAQVRDATEAIRRAGDRDVWMVTSSRYWRMTAPFRWTTNRLRAAARRRWHWAR